MALSRSPGSALVSPDAHEACGLAKIAGLYYLEGLGQREIAERLGLSVPGVSRALSRAKQLGIVRVEIRAPQDDFSALEIEMERRFGLRECLLVPRFEKVEHSYAFMARAAADFFSRGLKAGQVLGVSWGSTMKIMGERLPTARPRLRGVVPMVGAMGRIETGIYPNSIAKSFADRLGCGAFLVNTPAIVDSPAVRRSLLNESGFREVRELWGSLDAALLGVSDLENDSSARRGGIFSAADLALMKKAGGFCMSNFLVFDKKGREVRTPLSERVVCLGCEDLARVPRLVIAAAGPRKTRPIACMIQSGLKFSLITDADCARELLSGTMTGF